DIIGLVPFAEIRSLGAFLPRNCRPDHRAAVHEAYRAAAHVRIDDDIEPVQESRALELLLRHVGVRNSHLVEGKAYPSFVLCLEPGMKQGNLRETDCTLCHRYGISSR